MVTKKEINDELILAFSKSIQSGLKNASEVIYNISEIQRIFSEASLAISSSLEDDTVELKLNNHSGVSYFIAFVSKIDVEKINNSGVISIIRGENKYDFATWHQAKEGYPFTIDYDGAKYKCNDSDSLIQFLNNLFSNGAFWFKTKSKIYPIETISKITTPSRPSPKR